MLGDSVWDVEAAKRAGIPTVAVLTGGYSRGRAARRRRRRGLRVDRGPARAPAGPRRGRVECHEDATMSANRTRRTKIVATVGPASREPDDAARADRRRGRRLPAQLLARHRRGSRRERRADPGGRRGGRASRSGSSATCPGPKLRLGDLRGRRRGAALRLDGRPARRRERDRRNAERLPVQWEGISKAVEDRRPGLPRRRPGAAARSPSVDDGEVDRRGRGRRRGQLPPGREPARRRRRPARHRRRATASGSSSPASTGSTCSPSRSSAGPPTSTRSQAEVESARRSTSR